MKASKLIIAVLSATIVMVGISVVLPVETRPQPASASQNDKYDGDCMGTETDGRCADKCPLGSYLIDYRDGKPICKLEPTGCPYADSVPLGAECDKLAPVSTPSVSNTPISVSNQCGGGK